MNNGVNLQSAVSTVGEGGRQRLDNQGIRSGLPGTEQTGNNGFQKVLVHVLGTSEVQGTVNRTPVGWTQTLMTAIPESGEPTALPGELLSQIHDLLLADPETQTLSNEEIPLTELKQWLSALMEWASNSENPEHHARLTELTRMLQDAVERMVSSNPNSSAEAVNMAAVLRKLLLETGWSLQNNVQPGLMLNRIEPQLKAVLNDLVPAKAESSLSSAMNESLPTSKTDNPAANGVHSWPGTERGRTPSESITFTATAASNGKGLEAGAQQGVRILTDVSIHQIGKASQVNSTSIGGSVFHPEWARLTQQNDNPSAESNVRPAETAASVLSSSGDLRILQPTEPVHRPIPIRMAADQVPVDFSRFMLKQMTLTQGNGTSEATIKLVPEHLGQLEVKITIQNGHMTALFMADRMAGKELLDSQLPQLRAALQGQGLQVDKIEVSYTQQSHNASNHLFHGQHGRQQQSSGQSGQTGGRAESPSGYEAVDPWEADPEELDRIDVYRTSFNATA